LAPGNNFGIGFTGTSSKNLVEDNTIVGNSNGIFLQPTAVTNIFRRNLVIGNPPIQVAVNNPASNGFDIRNLSPAGANTFHANVCITSVNAPCPASTPPSLTASPNPIPVTGSAPYGMTTISWMAPSTDVVEVRIGSPDGVLFAIGSSRGPSRTGLWVPDGMTFYLQDVSGGKPLTAENTLATVVVRLQRR
jgi:parallel beta-helix repeat protein